MTDNSKALEDLEYIGSFIGVHVKNGHDADVLLSKYRNVHAALQNAPEVITFEQFKGECADCFIYSNVKSIAKMMQRIYPNGVKIVDEVK